MVNNNEHRVNKRSPYACTRCRRQKIKCSGQQPCGNCAKRHLICVVDESETKILVTQGYLSALQAKIARLEGTAGIDSNSNLCSLQPASLRPTEGNVQARHSLSSRRHPEETTHSSDNDTAGRSLPQEGVVNPDAPDLVNPLSITAAPKYMSLLKGLKSYLGTSSNWSFHGRVLNLVHTHVCDALFPSTEFLFEGEAYGLPWSGHHEPVHPIRPLLPSIDHAIFLINAVKFHCLQLLHLFDEEEFKVKLQVFYSAPNNASLKRGLWYVHFLVIIALGKALVQHKYQGPRPPGADLFQQAQQLLPDTDALCREPILAMEILCCIALYLHALDSRNAAHVTIGQAMRIGQAHGMHTDMPIQELGEAMVQRCRKIWWTVAILDRQMTSLMGIPQSIRADEITCQLPDFAESPQRRAALKMQISLSHIYADIARTVYGPDQRLRKGFVTSVKAVLDDLTALAEELRTSFPLQTDRGMSRLSAHLHLHHLQMVVLVTRPILFCCIERIFQAPVDVEQLTASSKVRHLMNMAFEASQSLLEILESLQAQGLLESFLPWDFDALFVSTTVLILVCFIDAGLVSREACNLDKAFALFECMIASGNDVAANRFNELRKLETMLTDYISASKHQASGQPASCEAVGVDSHSQQDKGAPRWVVQTRDVLLGDSGIGRGPESVDATADIDSLGFDDDLTAEQILALTESMDIEATDWLSSVICDQGYLV